MENTASVFKKCIYIGETSHNIYGYIKKKNMQYISNREGLTSEQPSKRFYSYSNITSLLQTLWGPTLSESALNPAIHLFAISLVANLHLWIFVCL